MIYQTDLKRSNLVSEEVIAIGNDVLTDTILMSTGKYKEGDEVVKDQHIL